ncbi:gamma-glutamylcyclotransferase [Paucisalibacillus globulus]|uniref:gamma-glutamylcyclotransferase n=1 Tax=Paucisalibacillus globulus TaxID=351095 RepID=UPI0003F8183B|nr:gamma-glutamylcyclotransferase [Paucisalibacillus globulus]
MQIELDELEEYSEGAKDNLYVRVVLLIRTEESTTSAYVYVAARGSLLNRRIDSGDWRINQ